MKFREHFLVKPGKALDLADHDPDYCAGMGSKEDADKHLEKYHTAAWPTSRNCSTPRASGRC